LIPAGVDHSKNFRSISFVGSVYKTLAKVLASRMWKVVRKVVGPNQHAFFLGHEVLNVAWIANECIGFYIKSI